ncbi:TetR/AcrR family transcriptional regulator [Nocardioides sp. LHD-245]|uniref:TetR/AcrR family transcriptional regulator n=1 Tax=Nocardioides sp. LHD-245 TaxID=3051387 RepID=UPI0027E1929A|nr:TetR/AcrR family transcriptional regulator [Nocardioides sp. LHD-245]
MTAASQEGDPAPRRRPKDRKQQIIVTARDLFVERGFPRVSMALIAEQLDITAGALYRHFSNKAVLLEEVFEDSFSYLRSPIPSDALEDAIDAALNVVVLHPYVADLWANEARHLDGEAQQRVRDGMRTWAHSFEPAIERERPGLDEGQLELVVWGLQSVLAFVSTRLTRASTAVRRPVLRDAALALARVDLTPTGGITPRAASVITPASTRERLLRAALDHFIERGYQESSMSSIGAAADVTGPNLYAYFESKADLFRAVQERATHAMWLHVDVALRQATSPQEALRRLVVGHVGIVTDWPHEGRALAGMDDIETANRAAQREYLSEWVALLRTLQPELDPKEARLRCLIVIKVINDLTRTPHVVARSSFPENIVRIAGAILEPGRSADA